MKLNFELVGADGVQRAIFGGISALPDLRPAWVTVAQAMQEMEAEAFAVEGARRGLPVWAPLSERYRRWKERHFPGRKILELTGDLRRSLAEKGRGHRRILSPTFMLFGTMIRTKRGAPYAMFHQEGTRRMPARPPLRPASGDYDLWVRLVDAYIRRAWRT